MKQICYHSSDWESVTGKQKSQKIETRKTLKNNSIIMLKIIYYLRFFKYKDPEKIFDGARDENLLITPAGKHLASYFPQNIRRSAPALSKPNIKAASTDWSFR